MNDFDLIEYAYKWLSEDTKRRNFDELPDNLLDEAKMRCGGKRINQASFEDWAERKADLNVAERSNFEYIRRIYGVPIKYEANPYYLICHYCRDPIKCLFLASLANPLKHGAGLGVSPT